MKINVAAYGPLNEKYVTNIKNVLNKCIEEYPRSTIIRVDLHFPVDKQSAYKKDNTLVTKFVSSLKSQIEAQQKRKNKSGVRVYKTKIRYIWVREFGQNSEEVMDIKDESPRVHYHVALLLNKDAYAYLGSFYEQDNTRSHNLSLMVMEAWIRALTLNHEDQYEKYYPLVHFPVRPYYHLNSKHNGFDNELQSVIDRLNYLAKIYSKDSSDGYRNFGCSQG